MANAKFKPLSFSTTMRNPNRISGFMSCILPFEGEVLTNDVIAKIIKNIIRKNFTSPILSRAINTYTKFTRKMKKLLLMNS